MTLFSHLIHPQKWNFFPFWNRGAPLFPRYSMDVRPGFRQASLQLGPWAHNQCYLIKRGPWWLGGFAGRISLPPFCQNSLTWKISACRVDRVWHQQFRKVGCRSEAWIKLLPERNSLQTHWSNRFREHANKRDLKGLKVYEFPVPCSHLSPDFWSNCAKLAD